MEEIILTKEITIFGKTISTSNQDMEAIGKLWQEAMESNVQNELFGIYHQYASNESGTYSLTVGGEKEVEGLSMFTIPTGKYLIIKTETNDISGVQKAWQQIWQNNEINRAYMVDFEWYRNDGTIEIYLSIK